MNRQIQPYILLAVFLVTSVFIGRFIGSASSYLLPLSIIVGIFIVYITFVNPQLSVMILILAMLLSPEVALFNLQKRQVVVRLEDVMIILMFMTWLVRMAVNKDLGLMVKTPVNKWIFGYSIIIIVSTALAVMRGTVPPIQSTFFVLKYIEYYMIFFLILNTIDSEKTLKLYLGVAFITCIIVTIYGYTQVGDPARLTAPFESPFFSLRGESRGEPGTLGGYYLVIFGMLFGFMSQSFGRKQVFLWGMVLFMIIPFFMTFSRSSYGALVAMIGVFMFLSKRGRVLMVSVSLCGFLVMSWVMVEIKEAIVERVMFTVGGGERSRGTEGVNIGGKDIFFEPSTGARVYNYRTIIKKNFFAHPFLGDGARGVGLVDAQFPRVLGESGMLGLFAFLGIIVCIFREAWRIYKKFEQPLVKSLSIGLIFALTGIMTHSIAANTFVIVRIMEPFWLMVALVMSLPFIYDLEKKNELTPNSIG